MAFRICMFNLQGSGLVEATSARTHIRPHANAHTVTPAHMKQLWPMHVYTRAHTRARTHTHMTHLGNRLAVSRCAYFKYAYALPYIPYTYIYIAIHFTHRHFHTPYTYSLSYYLHLHLAMHPTHTHCHTPHTYTLPYIPHIHITIHPTYTLSYTPHVHV